MERSKAIFIPLLAALCALALLIPDVRELSAVALWSASAVYLALVQNMYQSPATPTATGTVTAQTSRCGAMTIGLGGLLVAN